jgi:hypothetical protein
LIYFVLIRVEFYFRHVSIWSTVTKLQTYTVPTSKSSTRPFKSYFYVDKNMWNISQSSRYTSFFNLLHCTLNCLVSTKDHTLMCKHIYNICGYLVRSAKNRLPKWCPWINLHLLLFLPPILSISFFPNIVLMFMILYIYRYIYAEIIYTI